MKTIEIEIVRSGSRKDLKMDLDKVVKKGFRGCSTISNTSNYKWNGIFSFNHWV
ncbi:hypothetical protein [Bacillus toyonensis]|uniref:hypothetical protein n=1 Tax=Bacillus toyonensis TaxID=155322 RepID=UPI00211F05FC|nr:hypothetical protein [Bacillus toyonensis]